MKRNRFRSDSSYIEVALQGRRSSCSICGRIVLSIAMRRASNLQPLIAAVTKRVMRR